MLNNLLPAHSVSPLPLLQQPVTIPDLVIPVEIKGNTHQVYVRKRPYVDDFMKRMAQMFEVVVFTASLAEVWVGFVLWFSFSRLFLLLRRTLHKSRV